MSSLMTCHSNPPQTRETFGQTIIESMSSELPVIAFNPSSSNSIMTASSEIIEHGVKVGSGSHIAPGAVICGDVFIGERCFIGAGAIIKQGIKIWFFKCSFYRHQWCILQFVNCVSTFGQYMS